MTEDQIGRLLFRSGTRDSLQSVQALLILSLWAPVGGSTESGYGDGRHLIASAVSIAMNLRLNEASSKLRVMNEGQVEAIDDGERLDLTRKARVVCGAFLNAKRRS
jgi:hypothetical protein